MVLFLLAKVSVPLSLVQRLRRPGYNHGEPYRGEQPVDGLLVHRSLLFWGLTKVGDTRLEITLADLREPIELVRCAYLSRSPFLREDAPSRRKHTASRADGAQFTAECPFTRPLRRRASDRRRFALRTGRWHTDA